MTPDEYPMNKERMAELYTMLRTRKAMPGFLWTDDNNQTMELSYNSVFSGKPDWVGKWLIREIPRRYAWRPEPAELEELMLGKMGMLPESTDEAFAEMIRLRREAGPYGVPNPQIFGAFLLGPPPELSENPLLSKAVEALGGWLSVCNDDNAPALRAHFTASYERIVKRSNYQSLVRPDAARLTAELAAPRIPLPLLEKLEAVWLEEPKSGEALEDIDYDECYDN